MWHVLFFNPSIHAYWNNEAFWIKNTVWMWEKKIFEKWQVLILGKIFSENLSHFVFFCEFGLFLISFVVLFNYKLFRSMILLKTVYLGWNAQRNFAFLAHIRRLGFAMFSSLSDILIWIVFIFLNAHYKMIHTIVS